MANRYGEAALMAARQGAANGNPLRQWEYALESLYPTSPAARKKGTARGAFLGLCEEGLVKGIPPGSYSASRQNKEYAVHAANLLLQGTQIWSISTLWRAVAGDSEKEHNQQMDVVMALWKNGLIVGKP